MQSNLFIGRVFSISIVLLLSCDDSRLSRTLFDYQPRHGDILFQNLENMPLVGMIKGMSHSQYAHCGIVEKKDSAWFVLEPFSSVKETPLAKFIGRGADKTIDVFRLKPEYRAKIPVLLDTVKTFLKRPYDFQFELDDSKVYCSELIFTCFKKVYGAPLGQPRPLKTLNWRPYERTIRFLEHGPVPLERLVISPRALSEATQLELVYKGLRGETPYDR